MISNKFEISIFTCEYENENEEHNGLPQGRKSLRNLSRFETLEQGPLNFLTTYESSFIKFCHRMSQKPLPNSLNVYEIEVFFDIMSLWLSQTKVWMNTTIQ